MFILHRRWLMWSSIAVSFVLLVLLVNATKTGLIPEEDTGTVMVSMNTKPGTSMAQTVKVMERINSRLDSIGEIEYNGCRLLFQRFRSVAGHVFRDTQRLGTA